MEIKSLITVDPDILGGQLVFVGTRVSIESLFDHLKADVPLNEFLDDFPIVTKSQAVALLELANRLLTSKNAVQLTDYSIEK